MFYEDSSAPTENEVFDIFDKYIPTTNDKIPVTGSFIDHDSSSIDKELMVAWIKRKNSTIPMAHIEAVLGTERDFFEKLGVKI